MTSFTPSAPKGTTVSALTLARGRAAHLRNVILGLTRQTRQPDELVIGVMQDTLYDDLPQTDFPIRQVQVTGRELPLSRARNTVAAEAAGECLVFLDVDCIPAPELIADYMGYAVPGNGLIMGEVKYLPAGTATDGWSYPKLEAVAVRHSDRQGPPAEGLKRCNDYRCFWSLNFAIHREDWVKSGGLTNASPDMGARIPTLAVSWTSAACRSIGRRGRRSFTSTTPIACRRSTTSRRSCAIPRFSRINGAIAP